MSTTVITKTVFFAAAPETVWAFLTEKDKLAQWFHPADKDLKQGEDYTLLDQHNGMTRICWGTVMEMNAPHRLVYTFTVNPLKGALTTVTWTLEQAAEGTRLTLTHEGVEAAAGVGIERLVDVEPDVLFVATDGPGTVLEQWSTTAAWLSMPAARDDAVFEVDRNQYARFRGLTTAEIIAADIVENAADGG